MKWPLIWTIGWLAGVAYTCALLKRMKRLYLIRDLRWIVNRMGRAKPRLD